MNFTEHMYFTFFYKTLILPYNINCTTFANIWNPDFNLICSFLYRCCLHIAVACFLSNLSLSPAPYHTLLNNCSLSHSFTFIKLFLRTPRKALVEEVVSTFCKGVHLVSWWGAPGAVINRHRHNRTHRVSVVPYTTILNEAISHSLINLISRNISSASISKQPWS